MSDKQICRGDVIRVRLEPAEGSETKGTSRPCVVVQNDVGNLHAPTTIVIPLTDARGKEVYPFQVFIAKGDGGVIKDSIACCEQIRVINKTRIMKKMGHLRSSTIDQINYALSVSLGL